MVEYYSEVVSGGQEEYQRRCWRSHCRTLKSHNYHSKVSNYISDLDYMFPERSKLQVKLTG